MPDAADFLFQFNLVQGNIFGNYILSSVTSTHESIKRYQAYQFHITLVFKPNNGAKYDDLYDTLLGEISQEHVVYGTRDPYTCNIDPPAYGNIEEDTDGTIIFHLVGHATKLCRGHNCLMKLRG